jgi:(p)ppGpp synthase/HD superfamily hydrolase
MTFTVNDAAMLAYEFHDGQIDKGGKPYIQHPEQVAYKVFRSGGTKEQEMAAWLHDVVEDTEATFVGLAKRDVPAPVLAMVISLTHIRNEPLQTYWDRIRCKPDAVLVKLCDIWTNLDPQRLSYLSDDTQRRLRNKYGRALIALSK